MEFRLTYSGLLLSSGNDAKHGKADHKHKLRLAFHPQLKRLWDITPFLKTGERSGPSVLLLESSDNPPNYKASWLAKKHADFGWKFVPLVTTDLDLICELDILFLRPRRPGGLVKSGDIDGRLKTLLDALSKPDLNQAYQSRSAGKDETPLYVLLEDDELVTSVSVKTDQLLEYVTKEKNPNEVRLVITVRIRPHEMTLANMQFG